jgi:hypothetical protein
MNQKHPKLQVTTEPPVPVEQEVTITFSLTFPLSQLQRWANMSRLHGQVANAFQYEIQNFAPNEDLYNFLAGIENA